MTYRNRIMGWMFAALALTLVVAAGPGRAQENPFAAAVMINEKAITNYEISQRKRLLQLFRTPGDLDKAALEALIEDRLRLIAADAQGIAPSPEAVEAGEAEFASRANLTREQFLQAIGQAGVAPESFRDFVIAGIAWREVVRSRFGPRAQVTEAEVDRALALTSRRGGAEVLINEIILPANTPAAQARADRLVAQIRQSVTTEAQFASFARRFSASPSRGAGGRVARPLELANLPPALAAILLTLGPGEVSEPIPLQNAIALFQVRSVRETGAPEAEDVAVEYARYFIPGGTANDAAKVSARVDTCDDLYGVAKGEPEDRLNREALSVAEVPSDIALELAKLDEGEISTGLSREGMVVVLMLCGRTAALGEDIDRDAVRQRLINQRLASYGNGYLAELREDAIIRYP